MVQTFLDKIGGSPFLFFGDRFYFLNDSQGSADFIEVKGTKFGLSHSSYLHELERHDRTIYNDYIGFKNQFVMEQTGSASLSPELHKQLKRYYVLKFLIKEVLPLMTDFDAKSEMETLLKGGDVDALGSKSDEIFDTLFEKEDDGKIKNEELERLKRDISSRVHIPENCNIFEEPFFNFGNTVYALEEVDMGHKPENNIGLFFNGRSYALKTIGSNKNYFLKDKQLLEARLKLEAVEDLGTQSELAKSIHPAKDGLEEKLKNGLEFGDFGVLYEEDLGIYQAYLRIHPFALWNSIWTEKHGEERAPKRPPELEFSVYDTCRVAIAVDFGSDGRVRTLSSTPIVLENYQHPFLPYTKEPEPRKQLCMGHYCLTSNSSHAVEISTLLSDARNIIYFGYHQHSNPYLWPGYLSDNASIILKEICCDLKKVKELGLAVTNISDKQAKEWGVKNKI